MLENIAGNLCFKVSFVSTEMGEEEFVKDRVHLLLSSIDRLGFRLQSQKILLGGQSRVRHALSAVTQRGEISIHALRVKAFKERVSELSICLLDHIL